MIILVMGVAGAGKSTVGRLLAEVMGFAFADADAFHPAANVAKMRRGEPLDDADRMPWLRAIADAIAGWQRDGQNVVLACSALKRSYRAMLRPGPARVELVYLKGSPDLLRARLEGRIGHFAGSNLLESQLAALEEPEDALTFDIAAPPEALVGAIRAALAVSGAPAAG
ncbi:MAG: gluconokinase [Minicystis sp.]